ncbi:MAG: proton-conducting transporter membrane subunit [Verrucomicrobiota bacterium]
MTPDAQLLLCLLAPFIGALACLAAGPRPRVQAAIAVVAVALSLAAALGLVVATADGSVFAVHAGGWSAPFGIVLVADTLAALMLAVCQLVTLAALVTGAVVLPVRWYRRHFFPLVLTLSTASCGAFLTGDLFNLYVWFEVLLLSSFSLMAIMRGRDAWAGTWRYVLLNLVSSLLFLAAAGLIYGKTGSLNFADLHLRFAGEDDAFLLKSSTALLFGSFAIKSALLPFAFWLPSCYPQLPPAVSALFAGLLTKIGLYAMFRVFGMVFVTDGFPHRDLLLLLAVATMVGGVLGAVGQGGMRRILSFHIISQVGYMALALALFTPLALAAGIFYLVHHIVVKANLFLVTGLVERRCGSSELDRTGGLLRSAPWLAALFAVPALSLAGIPPLSGFFAKFALLRSSLELGDVLATVAIVGVGLLTVFSMLKIWRAAFWGETPGDSPEKPAAPAAIASSAVLAVVTILIGLAAGPLFGLAETAAAGLRDPSTYIDAVLGSGNPPEPTITAK